MKAKIFLNVAAVIFIAHSSFSQILSIQQANSTDFNFSFNPAAASTLGSSYPAHISRLATGTGALAASSTNPVTCTFLELGDGNFSFDETIPHSYSSTSMIYPLVYKTTGLYDDDPRPPRHLLDMPPSPMSSNGISSSTTAKLTMAKVLRINRSVGVMANINSVLAGDIMIFVVTYKLDLNADPNSYIRFSYNNINAFDVVDPNPATRIPYGTFSVPFVRPYFGETVTVEPGRAVGYSQALRISRLMRDSLEHHVFITMTPRSDLSTEKVPAVRQSEGFSILDTEALTANALAELFNGSGIKQDDDIKKYPVEDKAHDPNYIEMYPKCLSLPKKVEQIRFHVHCQNVGKGNAKQVKIIVALPGGLKTSDIDQNSAKDKAPFGVLGVWDYSHPGFLEVKFDLTRIQQGNSPRHTLNGSNNSPMYLSDENTMADIWFTLKTNANVPNLLTSEADIYFQNDNNLGTWNNAVKTNMDFVQYSECCNCKSKEKGCCDNRSKLWHWLFCKRCN